MSEDLTSSKSANGMHEIVKELVHVATGNLPEVVKEDVVMGGDKITVVRINSPLILPLAVEPNLSEGVHELCYR